MSYAAGTRLGHYEILGQIGAGGMGEVYRARDTRLGREVAIKVLPAAVSADPERVTRFEKEARSASSLNHPNIVTVYDIGESLGSSFIAMEVVEGPTLRDILADGAVPTKRLLSVAAQVADGLARAHAAGIVHRDLKPENLMVTRDGLVKILDFGLAKLTQPEDSSGATQSPTASGGTEPGLVMGTIGYMSPEQAMGKPLDFRSDQFACGSIVYEMATGKRAFSRGSAPETLAAIIREEPEAIGSLSPLTPTPLRWIVERCLAKSPDDRYASTRDLARDLATLKDRLSETSSMKPSSPARPGSEWARLAAAVLIGGLSVGAIWMLTRGNPAPQARVQRLTLTLPANAPIAAASTIPSLALSPDGTRLVYVATAAGGLQLYLRALDQPVPAPVAGTEGGMGPFFSPDGQWVGFFAGGRLRKVPLAGGAPITLCETEGTGGSWGDDGTIVFESRSALATIAAAGGPQRVLTAPDPKKGETYLNNPSFLPGSKAVVFSVWTGGSMGQQLIAVQPLATGARRVLPVKGACPRYVSTGHLVFVRDDESLMAAPFDLARLEVTGPAVPVAEGVLLNQSSGAAQYTFSGNGSLVYFGFRSEATLVWVDRRGKAEPVTPARHDFEMPRISPDGQRVAVGFEGEAWIYEIGRGTFTRLTFRGGDMPVWTPDGKHLAFMSSNAGPINQFWVPADGSASPERLLTSDHAQFPESFTPDGRHLAFMDIDPETGNDLWVFPLEGDRKPKALVRTPFAERGAAFSPDGRWVAYSSNESGAWQVYVQPYGEGGGKAQVSVDGGTEAVWARDGRELSYRSKDKMMAVSVQAGSSFVAGKPRLLFEGQYAKGPVAGFTNYDVTGDGQRFLMVKGEKGSAPTELNVVLNWFDDVKRRAVAVERP
jgi:serine/threonine-protein kinase